MNSASRRYPSIPPFRADRSAAPLKKAAFARYLLQECGHAPLTVDGYCRDAGKFCQWWASTHSDDWSTARLTDLQEYVRCLSTRKLSSATVKRNIASIRAYYRHVGLSTAEDLETPKQGQYLPAVPSESQIRAIIASASKVEKALVSFLYDTGCRISEAAAVRWDEVDTAARVVKILGKGSKERLVFFTTQTGDLLNILDRGDPRIFPFSVRWAQHLLREASHRAGVACEITPHSLRHACASHMIQGGADISVVQQILGHASPVTTSIYCHTDVKRLKAVHFSNHPMETGQVVIASGEVPKRRPVSRSPMTRDQVKALAGKYSPRP